MSDWHRNTNPDETAFITYGQLMEEKPYLKVKPKSKKLSHLQEHLQGYATQSAIFSNRIHTAELQPVKTITDHRRRPPRHLDPRIRRWDLNSNMWWPATVGPANLQAGQEDAAAEQERRARLKARSESAFQRDRSLSLSPSKAPHTPQTPPRKSLSRSPSKDSLGTPSPVSRASMSGSQGSQALSPARRKSQVSSTSKPERDQQILQDLLPEYYMKRGISMRYEKWIDQHGKPPVAPSLPFLTLHGDFRGADREFNLEFGSPLGPSGCGPQVIMSNI
jgi:hypothetical protein